MLTGLVVLAAFIIGVCHPGGPLVAPFPIARVGSTKLYPGTYQVIERLRDESGPSEGTVTQVYRLLSSEGRYSDVFMYTLSTSSGYKAGQIIIVAQDRSWTVQ